MIPLLLTLLTSPAIPDPCTLITKPEAEALLGEPVTKTWKEPAGPDEDTGGIHTSCSFTGKLKTLIISVDEFKSAAEASKTVTANYIKSQDDDPPPTVEAEPGLGDRAFFGHSSRAALMIAQKGARAYAAALGGKFATPPVGVRARLHQLVAAIAAKG